jgi:MFS family permease
MNIVRSEAELSADVPWVPILGVIATVSVFAIAQGLSYPLFTFLMQKQGMPPALIGLSAAMTPLGLIASAPFVPWLVQKVGATRIVVSCALAAGALFLLIGYLQNGFAWFVLRFLVGVVIDPLYVLSEVWMLSLAPPSRRGRLMGIYTAIIGAGFAAGPFSLMLVGTTGWAPFAIGITAFLTCAACLSIVAPRLPSMFDDNGHTPLSGFVRHAPALLLAVVVSSAFEQSAFALLPVYGASYEIPERILAALLATMVAGNVALQIPLGLLAERFTARAVMIACAVASLVGAALLPVLIETPAIWPMLFVLGAVSYGIYTMALIELGNRFSGAMLVTGNAAFGLMWGVGGIAGPPGAGSVMQFVGIQGLPVLLGALCVVLIGFAGLRAWQRRNEA